MFLAYYLRLENECLLDSVLTLRSDLYDLPLVFRVEIELLHVPHRLLPAIPFLDLFHLLIHVELVILCETLLLKHILDQVLLQFPLLAGIFEECILK